MRQPVNCSCGAKPVSPEKVRGLSGGFVVRCGSLDCPALVQRVGFTDCVEAWNEMASQSRALS